MQIIAVLFENIDEQELLEKIFQDEKVSHILGGESSQIENAA